MFEDNSDGYGVAGRSLGENNLFTLSFWPPIQGFDKISLSTDFSADESSFPGHQELFREFVEDIPPGFTVYDIGDTRHWCGWRSGPLMSPLVKALCCGQAWFQR